MPQHHKFPADEPTASASTLASQPESLSNPIIIDIHTHTYPPSYIDLLASRTSVPYIYQPPNADPRLIILPSDDDPSKPQHLRGRPVDKTYSSWSEKLAFMATHGISVSVVSLANPWLDFLPRDIAAKTAQHINDDLNAACESQNAKGDKRARLYGFASLPLSAPTEQIVAEIHRLKTLSYIKGIILGTSGLGAGLDDSAMGPIWAALEQAQTMIFLHPHYGLPDAAFGGSEVVARSGHVLPLALGFPLETTIAVARMFLAGVFDNFPKLKMLLAHSGGTIPFLAGRIQSCVEHEREFSANGGEKQGPIRSIWDVLSTNIWLDAVIYGAAGLRAAVEAAGASGEHLDGSDRLMFGTDHPFFPPLKQEKGGRWTSVDSNLAAIANTAGADQSVASKILGGNAARVLGIEV